MNASPRQQSDQALIKDLTERLRLDTLDTPLPIPPQTSFGRWLQLYHQAQDQPWRKQALGWVLDPDGLGLPAAEAPLSLRLLLRFYGYPCPQNAAQLDVIRDALRRQPGFAERASLEHALALLQQDQHALAQALTALVSRLEMEEQPFSLLDLYRNHLTLAAGPLRAEDIRYSLAQLLQHHGLTLLGDSDDAWNMIERIQRTPTLAVPPACDFANSDIALAAHAQPPAELPDKPRWGNYWEALGVPHANALTLSAEQRNTLKAVSATFLRSSEDRLLNLLTDGLPANPADEQLHQMLNRPLTQQLAQRLIEAVGWYGQGPGEQTNQASRDALVFAAILLDLDALAGATRYAVAGLQLNHPDCWGHDYPTLRSRVEEHLIDRGVATSQTTALAAHLLLSGVAPEFLVQDIPDALYFMTSYSWMVFQQGVRQAEAIAGGTSRHMTFTELMALATQDAPAEELPWREHCATASLIDWGIAQGHLAGGAETYSAEAIQALKQQLAPHVQALGNASEHLATPLTTRRAIALADLQRVFPGNTLLEKATLHWNAGISRKAPYDTGSAPEGLSLVDLHMSGQLRPGTTFWDSADCRVRFGEMRGRFMHLGDVNQQFNQAADIHVLRLKQAYTLAIQYLLAQMPLMDRQYLQQGDLQLLVVRLPAKVPLDQESIADKMARTGRFGTLLRCEHRDGVHYYELFPLCGQFRKNLRLKADLSIGGLPLSITTGGATSTRPRSLLFIGSPQPIDWAAYASGTAPNAGRHACVIVDRLPLDAPPDSAPHFEIDSPRCRAVAQSIVNEHFFVDIASLLASAHGSTLLEDQQKSEAALADFIHNLMPFVSCAKDLASGDTRRQIDGTWSCFFDLFGLLMPTRVFSLRALKTLRSLAPAGKKLLHMSALSAAYLNAALNPLDSVPALLRLGRHGLLRLNHAGQHLLEGALRHARYRLVRGGTIDYSRLVDRADVGSIRLARAEQVAPLLAIHHRVGWYGFDPFSARPYGPALAHPQLDTSLAVSPVHSVDGYQAWVVEPLFDTPPLILQRAEALDLVDNAGAWRFTPQHPGQLDEIASPAHVRLGETLEASCLSGRARRSPVPLVCFTKKLRQYPHSIHKRRVQALDHIRLIPGPTVAGARRKLVLHRRVYEVMPDLTTFKLQPLRTRAPLVYKQRVSALHVDDEAQFGLPADQLDNLLGNHSQVVRLAGIVEGIDDSRTLRALVITSPGDPTWVVEADVGVFYKATPPASGSTALQFDQLDYSLAGEDQALISAFCNRRNHFLRAGGMLPDRPLVALPTLETLARQLLQRGFSARKIARIRAQASGLSVIKTRELLLNASDQGRRLPINEASEPIQLETWPPRPEVLAGATAQPLNQFMAEQAQHRTQVLVEKTRIGSANTVGLGIEEGRRLQVAESVVMWEYSKIGHPNYADVILKTGAGNCDQMAHVACEMIRTNGGVAHVWRTRPAGHAFVLVGTPPAGLARTVDFSEPDWAGLWICDPWTAIACPASGYIAALRVKMLAWYLEDISVFFHDGSQYRWAQADDPAWLHRLTHSEKLAL